MYVRADKRILAGTVLVCACKCVRGAVGKRVLAGTVLGVRARPTWD
jgi:hypothetical protein